MTVAQIETLADYCKAYQDDWGEINHLVAEVRGKQLVVTVNNSDEQLVLDEQGVVIA